MKISIPRLTLFAVVVSTAAFAHSGVKDPQVMARMALMSSVADDMKVLGGIAKKQTAFNAVLVGKHAGALAGHAARIPDLFEPQATDPKTEAKDNIWTDWDGFISKTDDMKAAAEALAGVTVEADFAAAFGKLGKTCSGCHETYRINKN